MNLYETLNVKMNATNFEIERSYKRLLLEVHPTRNKLETDRYFQINEAYEILKDEYKRDFYNLVGNNSVRILKNSKEGFIISRCLSRFNIIIFFTLLMVCISNLLFLPAYIYKGSENYSLYILPFLVADCLFLLPIYRAYKAIGRLVSQLFNMLYCSVIFILLGFEGFVLCLSIDKYIGVYTGCLLASSLELASLVFKYYVSKKNDRLKRDASIYSFSGPIETVKKHAPRLIWSTSVLLMFMKFIPKYLKVAILFTTVFFYVLNLDLPYRIKSILFLPVILYSTTFCLAVFNVRSIFIFTPLSLLLVLLLVGFVAVYKNLFTLQMKNKEITYIELV